MNPPEFLERLSLRRRLMVPSLLGLALLIVLAGAFMLDTARQNALLSRVSSEDIVELEHHSRALGELYEHHIAVWELLHEATAQTEEQLYDQSKGRVAAIRATLGTVRALAGNQHADHNPRAAALKATVVQHTEEYARAVFAAIELATVDIQRAPQRLAVVNGRFQALNDAYAAVLAEERDELRSEIATSIEASRTRGQFIALGGVAAAAILVLIAIALARVLARSLEMQIDALERIGATAGAPSTVSGDEVERIGRAIAAFGVLLEDLTAEVESRRRAEGRMRIFEEAIRSTGEAVAIAGADGRIIEVNPAHSRAIGACRETGIGAPLFGAIAGPAPDAFREGLWEALRSSGHWSGEVVHRRCDGEIFPSWVTANAVDEADGQDGFFVCVSRDITRLKESEEQLQKLAFFDTLTGLANRALFNDRLRVAFARAQRRSEKIAVLDIDLDRFKDVNDTLGHEAGDRLLVEVSRRLSAEMRSTDTLARLGGDEFAVLLTSLDSEEDASNAAARLIEAVSGPIDLGGDPVFVGASVGIAHFPDDAGDLESLRKHADLAMYEAKALGRGQFRRFSAAMVERANERATLTARIESALANDEFVLHYQPIVATATGAMTGVEALIRWPQADGTFVSPATFIPHAEETGLIKRIDRWVLERACADAVRWNDATHATEVSVNVSPVSLQQPDLPAELGAILHRTGLAANRLRVEITETAVISHPKSAGETLDAISAMGVGVSLDDFGTGYSSLNHLIRYPINRIKLDRSFIQRIGTDSASEAIIRSILELAARLGIGVVAEGVEHARQRGFLQLAGCPQIQGFHIAKAITAAQIAARLDEPDEARAA